jgi:hypothetical protein
VIHIVTIRYLSEKQPLYEYVIVRSRYKHLLYGYYFTRRTAMDYGPDNEISVSKAIVYLQQQLSTEQAKSPCMKLNAIDDIDRVLAYMRNRLQRSRHDFHCSLDATFVPNTNNEKISLNSSPRILPR